MIASSIRWRIVIVDTQGVRESGVTFGQLSAFIAMVGLAELRSDPKLGAAPTILSLFSTSEKERSPGLSSWDQAYLKALYNTGHADRTQLAEIRRRCCTKSHLDPYLAVEATNFRLGAGT